MEKRAKKAEDELANERGKVVWRNSMLEAMEKMVPGLEKRAHDLLAAGKDIRQINRKMLLKDIDTLRSAIQSVRLWRWCWWWWVVMLCAMLSGWILRMVGRRLSQIWKKLVCWVDQYKIDREKWFVIWSAYLPFEHEKPWTRFAIGVLKNLSGQKKKFKNIQQSVFAGRHRPNYYSIGTQLRYDRADGLSRFLGPLAVCNHFCFECIHILSFVDVSIITLRQVRMERPRRKIKY